MSVKKALIILGILFVMVFGFFGYLYYDTHRVSKGFDSNNIKKVENTGATDTTATEGKKEVINDEKNKMEVTIPQTSSSSSEDWVADKEERTEIIKGLISNVSTTSEEEWDTEKEERIQAIKNLLEKK